jgi:hypothetical protein
MAPKGRAKTILAARNPTSDNPPFTNKRGHPMRTGTIVTLVGCVVAFSSARAVDNPPPAPPDQQPAVRRALAYLGRHQHAGGGWGHWSAPVRTGGQSGNLAPPPINDALSRRVGAPPTLGDTAAVLTAFLDASQPVTGGDSAKPLHRALDFVCDQLAPFQDGKSQHNLVAHYALNAAVETAIGLEALLAYRARVSPTDAPLRGELDGRIRGLIARLSQSQRPDGGWPLDPRVVHYVNTLALLEQRKAELDAMKVASVWADYHQRSPNPLLGDAVIVRSLLVASRAGYAVEPEVLSLGTGRLMAFYDPATGRIGDGGPNAFYQAAAVLNVLHQQLAAAPAAQRPAAREALAAAHEAFFRTLRVMNAKRGQDGPLAARPGPRAGQNPLDAKAAGNAAAAADPLKIPVPVSSVDAIGYFLLLESLQTSTHPDARPVAAGVTDVLTRHQLRGGGWADPSVFAAAVFASDKTPDELADGVRRPMGPGNPDGVSLAFGTAWVVRTLLVPLPPPK